MPQFKPGQKATLSKTFTEANVQAFAEASGDKNPVHLDEAYAQTTRFGKRIVHGMLVAGLISAVLGTQLPGPGTIFLGQELSFKAPVYIGDTVTAEIEVATVRDGKPIVTLKTNCYNQDGTLVIEGKAIVMYPL
ncbi:MAG TPA: MaoC family dehydratase [Anaerolineales bacterium]|nr:MaoC family dehydratase [Anaerolineales bacterium]